MCRTNLKHNLIICTYGALLLIFLVGTGNLFGSRVDWLSQHTVFPDTFRQAFYESGKLIPEFLFDIGGGQNIFHFVYYGFLSPGILLSYLLPFVDMTIYIVCLCIVSYLLSGCLLYQFLKKHFREEIALWAGIIFLTLPPMTYHFHHHIMFVWYMPFFILGLMGVDRYFEKKKSGLFLVSVFCMILTNYMFSVGCLVFLFVYAVFCIFQSECFLWNKFGTYLLGVIVLFLIPVVMSAFLLLPTAYTLFSNDRSGGSGIELYELIFPSFEEYFYTPYSMGISAIMIVVVFGNFTCRTKKRADLFLNIFALLVLVCPMILYVLNGSLYVRGKALIACSVIFIYNFCLFIERLSRNEIHIKMTMMLSLLFVVLFVCLHKENGLVGLALLIELLFLWCFWNLKKIWFIFPVLISLAATFVSNMVSETYVTTEYYEEMYQDEISELMEYTEGNFYRTNIAYREMDIANRIYGEKFHGTSLYSSTYNTLYQQFYESYMGNNEKYRNEFMTTGAINELFYHFMGTKYIIGTKDPGLNYELVKKTEHLNLYKNEDAFPVVYKSKQIMSETQFDQLAFPFTTEAFMMHTVVDDGENSSYENSNYGNSGDGIDLHEMSSFEPESLHTNIKACDVPNTYQFIQEHDETYRMTLDESYKNKVIYLTFDIKNQGKYLNGQDISISINGITNKLTEHTWLYYNGNTTFEYVIPMENRITLNIHITKGRYDIQNIKMYTSDQISTTYEEAENLFMDEAASKITCKVTARKGEYLVTSIPYDAGFSAYINGEKTEVEIVNKAFVGVALQDGNNDIEIIYHAPFYRQGIWISCFGIFLWMIKGIWDRRCTNENISSSTMLQ